jgi:DNA-binding XRE family transcriptional regulator
MKKNTEKTTCHLKRFRMAKGWSQTQLADMVGIKRQAVYDIEPGRYLPNTIVAIRLGKHLECSVEDLFGCDPAFSILASYLSRALPAARLHCRFASSHNALSHLPKTPLVLCRY